MKPDLDSLREAIIEANFSHCVKAREAAVPLVNLNGAVALLFPPHPLAVAPSEELGMDADLDADAQKLIGDEWRRVKDSFNSEN